MGIYINGIGLISAQDTLGEAGFLQSTIEQHGDHLLAHEPNYKEYINPRSLRRMARTIKMGVAAATVCLKEAAIENPDAIVTGTGLGCVADTTKFLDSIIESETSLHSPSSFIQSTHNTVAGQIALMLKCKSYNFTYVNNGSSFESALQDAYLQLLGEEASNILVGGIDEITNDVLEVFRRFGKTRRGSATSNLDIMTNPRKGSLLSEGAGFFMLSNQQEEKSYAVFKDMDMFYKPSSEAILAEKVEALLQRQDMSAEDIDFVMLGYNGDYRFDSIYEELKSVQFKDKPLGHFKHLGGEFCTSNIFGMWSAANILKTQTIPSALLRRGAAPKEVKNILLINHYQNIHHAIILLEKC